MSHHGDLDLLFGQPLLDGRRTAKTDEHLSLYQCDVPTQQFRTVAISMYK